MKKDEPVKTYEQGLEDGWNAAKKIVLGPDQGGMSMLDVSKTFGTPNCCDVLTTFSAHEALTKLNERSKALIKRWVHNK